MALASLVVELSANIARFDQDMNRAASLTERTAKTISSAADIAKSALEGIGLAFTINAVMDWAKGTVAAASALDDLSDSTGSSVENLSRLNNMATISGASFETMKTMVNRLAAGMAGVDDESSKVGRALKALGVDATDPAQALNEVALKLDQYADGINKAALARDLFGKQGVAFLATLKDMARMQDVSATITTKQAEEAEKLEQALRRMTVEAGLFRNMLLTGVVPAMNEMITQFKIARANGLGFWDTLIATVKDTGDLPKSIGEVEKSIKDLTSSMETQRKLGNTFKLPDMQKDLDALKAKLAAYKQMQDALNLPGSNRAMEDRGFAPKANLDYTGAKEAKAAAEGVNEYTKALEALYRVLDNTASSVNDEFFLHLTMLHGEFNAGEMSLEKYQARVAQLIANTKFGAEQIALMESAQKALTKAFFDAVAAEEALVKARWDDVAAAIKNVEQMEFENTLLGLTNTEREIAIRLRELETQGILKGSAAYNTLAERIRNAAEAKEGIQAQIDLWGKIESVAHDTFVGIFTDGKNAFDKLKATLKSFLVELLYMSAKRWVLNFIAQGSSAGGGGIGGLAGAFAGAAGGGGDGGGMGGLGNLIGSGIGLAGGLSMGAGVGGSAIALTGSMAGAGVGFGVAGAAGAAGAGMGLATAAMAAIPVIGWIVAAGALIYSLVQANKEPAMVKGRFGIGGMAQSFEDQKFTASRFGNLGFLDKDTQQFSGEAAQGFNKMIGGVLDAIGKRLDDTQIQHLSTRLQGTNFGTMEGTFTTEDFLKKYGAQVLQQVVVAALEELSPALSAVMAGFKGTTEEIAAFTDGLLELYDISAKLPTAISDSLVGALDGTMEGLTRVTALARAYNVVQTGMNSDPMEEALAMISAASSTAYDAFIAQGVALSKLIDKFDGSTEAANALSNATVAYYQAQVTLLAALEQAKSAINDLFATTARSIQMSILDTPGKMDFLAREGDGLLRQLLGTKDPEDARRLADRLNANINESFGMLDPEQQRARAQEYLDYIDRANRLTQDHLNDLQQEAQQRAADQLSQLRDVLTEQIASMNVAAGVQLNAAQINLTAAQTPVHVEVDVQGLTPEVNG